MDQWLWGLCSGRGIQFGGLYSGAYILRVLFGGLYFGGLYSGAGGMFGGLVLAGYIRRQVFVSKLVRHITGGNFFVSKMFYL